MTTVSEYTGKSARENVEIALRKARENEDFNAIVSYADERALQRADKVDTGEITGRLAGVPFVAKDNFLTLGSTTTASSDFLKDFTAPLQATAIEKLEAEGAICIAKANLDAFAHGGSTENSAFGPTKNAYNQQHVAGGSSGGSAVVVALDIVPFALGTDTGGSIRQPASFNNVVGIKPTYGTVSRYGVVAMASSTDTIGVLSNSIDDAELVMDIISGKDQKDMTTLNDFYRPQTIDSPKKIGVIKEFMDDGVDEDVKAATTAYIAGLKQKGHKVEEVSLSMVKYALAIYYIVVPAEISSNLGRYDGIRYGQRAIAATLGEVYGLSRDKGFMPENKRRIMIGSYVLSSGYFDAYYLQAQKARTLLIEEFNKLFETYDALIGPVAPTPAFKLGENTHDPVQMYLADIMTVPASLAGLPAISVPAGMSREGLPIGVQLIGARKSDSLLIALAKEVQ
jgi:aspartyl-tRNA(Asn)/glutamyl-tRNA(Gln) amidotransferase subunit A